MLFLLICVVAGPRLSIVTLALATMSLGACFSNLWAITQTLAGPEAAGRWTGVQNFAGNLAGWFGPALTGFVLDRTGQFFWPVAITAQEWRCSQERWPGCLWWVRLKPVVWDLPGHAAESSLTARVFPRP